MVTPNAVESRPDGIFPTSLKHPAARCLEDINNFWMAHKPKTMSELYSHLHEELELRLAEAERVGYGFEIPKVVVPSVPRFSESGSTEIAA